MRVQETTFMKEFIRMCEDVWKLGWHECHAGNLSYRLTEKERKEIEKDLDFSGAWIPSEVKVKQLAEELIFVTGSGKTFRNTPLKPEVETGIVEMNAEGTAYRIVWGFEDGGHPTSEFPTHLINLAIKKEYTDGRQRVVYHAHPENIIALSFVLPLKDEILTRELWEMLPECAMTFPEGMGVLPWMVPGTKVIAERTGELMKQYSIVLWAQHGIFAAGRDFDEVLGLIHTVEKSASMLMKVLAVAPYKRQPATAKNLRDMADIFHLDLPSKFLY